MTSAAVVMVTVFASFATLTTLDMKQLGVGLAAAVLIDATIVRAVAAAGDDARAGHAQLVDAAQPAAGCPGSARAAHRASRRRAVPRPTPRRRPRRPATWRAVGRSGGGSCRRADRLPVQERALLDAARAGDESAFTRLLEGHRRELQVHCYRMLGSVHDAEDRAGDVSARLARARPVRGPYLVALWLYRIATNACLDASTGGRRVLPIDHGGPDPTRTRPGHAAGRVGVAPALPD